MFFVKTAEEDSLITDAYCYTPSSNRQLHIVDTRSVVVIRDEAGINSSEVQDSLAHLEEHFWWERNARAQTRDAKSCSILGSKVWLSERFDRLYE